MNRFQPSVATAAAAPVVTNKLIRNTYSLLSLTLIFSAITAGISMFVQTSHIVSLVSLIAAFVLMIFVLPRTARSAMGLAVVFAGTGLLGFSLGPMLNAYLGLENGGRLIMTALSGTGVIFLGLSGYALTTKKDFSFLGGFLFVGLLVVIMASLANIFLAMPAVSLAVSAGAIMIFSGFILYDTSRMVNGGETNYLFATVGLYLSIFNIFIHLLQLLGALGGDD